MYYASPAQALLSTIKTFLDLGLKYCLFFFWCLSRGSLRWTLCSQLANYWRTWFNVPTEGATFEPYEETPTPVAPDTPGPVQETTPDDNQSPQIPDQILQVAWFLSALLNENLDTNAGLIQQIRQRPIGQLRDLRHDRVDQHPQQPALCAELGILASMLSQQPAASQEIAELSHENDGI